MFFLLPNLGIIYGFVGKPRKAEWWLHPVVTQNQESFVVLAGAFFYNLILIQVKTTFLAGRRSLDCLSQNKKYTLFEAGVGLPSVGEH